MKVLKSYRDNYFTQWNMEEWSKNAEVSSVARFDYVSVNQMQRGDVAQESVAWLKKNAGLNFDLLGSLRESIPRDGMFSPIILVRTTHRYWEKFIGKNFWLSIPYVIQSGNNRYRVAVENDYTHISSIMLGINVDPRVFNYLQDELKKPLKEKIRVDKDYIRNTKGLLI